MRFSLAILIALTLSLAFPADSRAQGTSTYRKSTYSQNSTLYNSSNSPSGGPLYLQQILDGRASTANTGYNRNYNSTLPYGTRSSGLSPSPDEMRLHIAQRDATAAKRRQDYIRELQRASYERSGDDRAQNFRSRFQDDEETSGTSRKYTTLKTNGAANQTGGKTVYKRKDSDDPIRRPPRLFNSP